MPLMGSFYVGSSGLQTSQNALHATAHNLSNIDTVGYTRHQTVKADKIYNTVGRSHVSDQQVGLGVSYAKVRQVRDFFLDRTYRLEAGRTSFYDNSYTVATEIETLFGEMEGVEFQTSLSDLWVAAEELSKNPTDATNQGLFVSSAASFLERAQAVYNGLSSYQDNLNEQISDTVDQINDYGKQIWELNRKIIGIEAGKTESANDLRDVRNQVLDELSKLTKIAYSEDAFGAVSVSIEGVDFVTRTYMNPMGVLADEKTGFYTVVWPQDNNSEVFNLKREISSDHDTDIGGLKALELLRGENRGRYTDIPVEPDKADYTSGAGVFDATAYQAAVKQYKKDVEEYNKTVNKSLIQNTMAEFDKLVNGIVTGINEVLNPNQADGTSGGGINVFLRANIDDQKPNIGDAIPPVDPAETITYWSVSNLKVNPTLLQQYTYLGTTQYKDKNGDFHYTTGFTTHDGSEDHSKSDALVALFDKEFSSLNPNSATKLNFMNYYKSLIGEEATMGKVYKHISESQQTTLDTIDASRQQVVGVSDNEELSNMIMYQNAYNAASRYINTVNDMLGTLIQSIGV